MRLSFLLSLFREDIIRALFWTLVHSLWQGLALAVLAGLVILCTRRSAPVWRYNIFLGLLCLFAAGAGATFFLMVRAPQTVAVPGGGAVLYPGGVAGTSVVSAVSVNEGMSWGQRLTAFFNQQANIIVAIWFIVLGARLGKILFDMWGVRRLRCCGASEPDGYWKERVKELAKSIGIKKAVRILESSMIKTPMMAGVLKPVILVPLGLLAKLPPQEMEAILLHELAHIRRKDYLTNILQCFLEMIFFFNPAVLWISSLIREERENCCDDIAVGKLRSKRELVSALVSFQDYSYPKGALTFAGKKDYLLQRVKRIVHRDNKTLNMREKLFLLACLFVTLGLTLTYARETPSSLAYKGAKVETIWQAPPVKDVPAADNTPAKTSRTSDTGQHVKAVESIADTSKRPAPIKDTSVGDDERRKRTAILQRQRAELEVELQKLNNERSRLDDKVRELAQQQAKLELQSLNVNMDTLPIQKDEMIKNEQLMRDNDLRLEGLARLQGGRNRESERRFEEGRARLELLREADGRGSERFNDILKPVLRMLMAKGLVSQLDDISFSLTDKQLVVNGKKQPDAIFQEFKKEFIHGPKDYIIHSKHGGSESTSISQNN